MRVRWGVDQFNSGQERSVDSADERTAGLSSLGAPSISIASCAWLVIAPCASFLRNRQSGASRRHAVNNLPETLRVGRLRRCVLTVTLFSRFQGLSVHVMALARTCSALRNSECVDECVECSVCSSKRPQRPRGCLPGAPRDVAGAARRPHPRRPPGNPARQGRGDDRRVRTSRPRARRAGLVIQRTQLRLVRADPALPSRHEPVSQLVRASTTVATLFTNLDAVEAHRVSHDPSTLRYLRPLPPPRPYITIINWPRLTRPHDHEICRRANFRPPLADGWNSRPGMPEIALGAAEQQHQVRPP